ncbi:MAG: hypothetical protein ACK5D9_03965 [Burkholderiales bacterium]|jgi:hypothetical protein
MINDALLFSALLAGIFPVMLLRFAFQKEVMFLALFFSAVFFIAAVLAALLTNEPLGALLALSLPAVSMPLAGLLGLAYGLTLWIFVGLIVNSYKLLNVAWRKNKSKN